MHCEELRTICDAHKASMFCSDSAKARGLSLNTDGTTKHQKKLGGGGGGGGGGLWQTKLFSV